MNDERYDWVKKLGQWHQSIGNSPTTICGMPMLGNNYASYIPEADREKCKECFKSRSLGPVKIHITTEVKEMPKKNKNIFVSVIAKNKCPHCGTRNTIVYGFYEYINNKRHLVGHHCENTEICVPYMKTMVTSFLAREKNYKTVTFCGSVPDIYRQLENELI